MALRDELHEQGRFLFRHRGKTSLLFLGLFFLAMRESQWIESTWGDTVDDAWDIFCVALSVVGLAWRIAIAGTVPNRTSGRNTRKGQMAMALNSTGHYSVVRHPLYAANFLIILGICLTPGSIAFAVAASAIFWLVHERVMLAEEEFLRSSFGETFERWAARTPLLIPDLRLYVPSALPYSFRTAVKREYLTVLAAALVYAAVDYVEDALALGGPGVEWEPETTVPAVLVLVAAVIIRFLRKQTKVLHLSGR